MRKGKRVIVQDGNVEKALRKFKKKISDTGILQEVRDREQFIKPTIKLNVDGRNIYVTKVYPQNYFNQNIIIFCEKML